MEIAAAYDPRGVERRIYDFWMEGGWFRASVDSAREPFVISMPPPNVYGSLHIGHGFNLTLQDLLTRFYRMRGYNALWVPGLDHAGLAFQNAVERQLQKEGLSRFALGRERFLERSYAWKEEQCSYVVEQLHRLGASADWERTRFTLDPSYQRAVRRQFVRLFQEGLIYRGSYITQWCPRCRTALSDIEVEHEEEQGHLWYVRYPFTEGEGYITVATTRPETILGDTGVAVHPGDQRYRALVGQEVTLPILHRKIPIVADGAVDPCFGSGAVKITPAHDPTDFEIGQRHGLLPVLVIGEDGQMTEEAGPFRGIDRYLAREKVIEQLEREGLLEKEENYSHAVGHCYRCHDAVEPLLSRQWFVRMKPFARPAIECVRKGEVVFAPSRWTKVYLNWMENIRDWCISRQIWWGHRIPVFYCNSCGEMCVTEEDPTKCPACGSGEIEQDPDALDTWFSSNLWPFAILGWPEDTPELHYFFPNQVLSTGYDIIFFWVARMIMASLFFMHQVPFHKVYIHGLIRDGKGRKMSRSLGNVIDPMEKMEKYGTDAFRFTMASSATLGGQDIPLAEERLEHSRNFANKLWNASRFVLMGLENYHAQKPKQMGLPHRYILSRLQQVIQETTQRLEEFDFGEATHGLEEFFWGEYCDWYIEMCKVDLYAGGDEAACAQYVMRESLEALLRLLHPIVPFITEELWQKLPEKRGEALIVAPWPLPDPGLKDRAAEEEIEVIKELVRAVRNLRAEAQVPPGEKMRASLIVEPEIEKLLRREERYILPLARLSQLEFLRVESRPATSLSTVAREMEIFLPLSYERARQLISRMEKDAGKIEGELERARSRLKDEEFLSRAPQEVVLKQQSLAQELQFSLERVQRILRDLGT